MNIYFVRHGESLMNNLNKGQGWLDSDLTQEGIIELHTLFSGNDLPIFDCVYSSDLGRAINTFQIIRQYTHIKTPQNVFFIKELRERFLGSFEGDSLKAMQLFIAQQKGYDNYAEYEKNNSFADYINDNHKLDLNGYAESYNMFKNRVMKGVQQIITDANTNNWENILVIAHRNSIGLAEHSLVKRKKISNEFN